MDVRTKLQIKPGQRVLVVGGGADAPAVSGIDLAESPEDADAVVAFVIKESDLATAACGAAIAAAREDRLAWIAYPKDRQLGTDLNRDILGRAAQAEGIRPVRQIAIDDVWSALRFRPA